MSVFQCISVDEAEQIVQQKNVLVLDMRDARAFCTGHHPRAIHLDDGVLRPLIRNTPKQVPVVIYCYHGNASRDMAQLFADFGFEHCYSVDGGYDAWRKELGLARRLAQLLTLPGLNEMLSDDPKMQEAMS